MISVIVPTLNVEPVFTQAMTALVPAVVEGVVSEVIVSDGGSQDKTLELADGMGAKVVRGDKGRGPQLRRGAKAAKGDWFLFLHADTVLERGWAIEVADFIARAERNDQDVAAVFRFALDDPTPAARRIERWARLRSRLLSLPYGDQGLLIRRRHYEGLGGYKPIPLMEDVDIVRRIGSSRLTTLRSEAVTSAVRYQRDGYWARPIRNLGLLTLFYLRVPTSTLVRLYG